MSGSDTVSLPSSAFILSPGEVIGDRYRVLQTMGRGGFSQIYTVADQGIPKVLNIPKVLKVLVDDYPQCITMFEREAKVLSELDHPGIPRVDAQAAFTFTAAASPQLLRGFVMEKIPGQDLKVWLHHRQGQPIYQVTAIDWLKQLAEVLAALHQKNYFHRDIKPSNIMLKPDGQLVLIDFGGVRAVTDSLLKRQRVGQTGTRLASRGYTPPEQVDGWAVPQSDFFALGRTFVALLTGQAPTQLPLHSRTWSLVWRDRAPQISASFADLIDWLMAPQPGDRPQTAQAILTALTTLVEDTNAAAPEPVMPGETLADSPTCIPPSQLLGHPPADTTMPGPGYRQIFATIARRLRPRRDRSP